jgi:hypothetical protein
MNSAATGGSVKIIGGIVFRLQNASPGVNPYTETISKVRGNYFRVADHPECRLTSPYKRVCGGIDHQG